MQTTANKKPSDINAIDIARVAFISPGRANMHHRNKNAYNRQFLSLAMYDNRIIAALLYAQKVQAT